jgi:formate dehydrogenase subunit delta
VSSQLQQLIRMINQISANLDHGDAEKASGRVAAHVKKFWARSMKQQIIQYADSNDGRELSEVSRRAVEQLKERRSDLSGRSPDDSPQ